MRETIRHRIVSAPTLDELGILTSDLETRDWVKVGEASIAMGGSDEPPYWTQAMYRVVPENSQTTLSPFGEPSFGSTGIQLDD